MINFSGQYVGLIQYKDNNGLWAGKTLGYFSTIEHAEEKCETALQESKWSLKDCYRVDMRFKLFYTLINNGKEDFRFTVYDIFDEIDEFQLNQLFRDTYST